MADQKPTPDHKTLLSERSGPTDDPLALALRDRAGKMSNERNAYVSTWDQLANYVMPSKATFRDGSSPNLARERSILDSTAPIALIQFASAVHGMFNDPAAQWFSGTLDGVGEFDAGYEADIPYEWRLWLEATRKIMLRSLTYGNGDLYTTLFEMYLDQGLFGTASAYVDQDPIYRGSVRTTYVRMSDLLIAEGEHGRVDFVIRKVAGMTARKLRQKWPKAWLGKKVEEALKSPEAGRPACNPFMPVTVMHAVFPATDDDLVALIPDGLKPGKEWNFYSVWYLQDEALTIAVGGFDEFPYPVARWLKVGGQTYGRSPGMTALGDILMVNRMAESVLRGAEKIVDPPLRVDSGMLLSPVRLTPAGITHTEAGAKIEPLIPPGASRIELGEALIEKRQDAIREAFFVPLFTTPASPVKTATQVLQEVDERNKKLAPMLRRIQAELFDPILSRCFGILWRQGMIPQPPGKLDLSRMGFRYINPVTAAIAMQEALATARMFELIQPWAQVDTGAFDPIKTDEIVSIIQRASGTPASIMRSAADLKKLRADKEQMAQQQALLNALPQAATAQAALRQAGAAQTKADAAAAKGGM